MTDKIKIGFLLKASQKQGTALYEAIQGDLVMSMEGEEKEEYLNMLLSITLRVFITLHGRQALDVMVADLDNEIDEAIAEESSKEPPSKGEVIH